MKPEWDTSPEALRRFIPGSGRNQPKQKAKDLIHRLSKKDEKTGCWIFHKEPNSSGYPYMNGYGPSHRVSFWAFKCPKGKVPGPRMNIYHRCLDHQCVNPDHLIAAQGQRQGKKTYVPPPFREGDEHEY